MKSIWIAGKKWAATALMVGAVSTGFAEIIYNNSTNDLLKRWETSTYEVGDEIVLTQSDLLSRILTRFTFEFWATNSSGGALSGTEVSVTLRLYQNDGIKYNGFKTPGTQVGYSSLTGITATERSTLSFLASDFSGTVTLPSSNMTWTVQFSGLGDGDHVGLDIYSPPVVGQNFLDYWIREDGGWKLKSNSVAPMSFGATIEAVPEPATAWLFASAGLLGLVLIRRNLRKK